MRFVPGRVIVRWRADVVPNAGRRSVMAVTGALPQQVTERLRYLRDHHGLKHVVTLSPDAGGKRVAVGAPALATHAEQVARSLRTQRDVLRGATVLEFGPKADLRAISKALRDGVVQYAQPAPARWLAARRIRAQQGARDPRYGSQWGLVAIEWPDARRPSARAVKVAVLDSGVDTSHPDLAKAITSYDHSRFRAADLVGHGTHVAGIIGATTNNKIGIAGVARCGLRCWKVFGDEPEDDGEIYLDNEAYYQALGEVGNERDVKVINLSIGGVEEDALEADLVRRIVARDDKLIIAAMGNEYEEGNPTEYPAALPGVLAVGAIGPNLRRATFSNLGSHIGIVAPGTGILSTLPLKKSSVRPETEYDSWDGTSMATPFVSGAAALAFARRGDHSGSEIRDLLVSRARRVPAMGKAKKKSRAYGKGLLNLKATLR